MIGRRPGSNIEMVLKYSWYQTDSQVILEFFVKNLSSEQAAIDLEDDKVGVS